MKRVRNRQEGEGKDVTGCEVRQGWKGGEEGRDDREMRGSAGLGYLSRGARVPSWTTELRCTQHVLCADVSCIAVRKNVASTACLITASILQSY